MGRPLRVDQAAVTSFWWRTALRVLVGSLVCKITCRGRDTEPCDTQESIERYVRTHIFCMLGTVVFPDKSTTSLNSKFLPLLRNFHRISAYSWEQSVWRTYTDRCAFTYDMRTTISQTRQIK
ncbi:hypothetical protein Ahy_A03g016432 [Arachis hypogaea]|uniref:Aminotransferase-like plant mobile domain-containing protein n=1 Tax=Arachis hypogaea TaxID=3818 RepID=A0A445E3F8_ARAHY|nr:hypothetical protein Ahy_A03g016432 [Arachis hypogaea]